MPKTKVAAKVAAKQKKPEDLTVITFKADKKILAALKKLEAHETALAPSDEGPRRGARSQIIRNLILKAAEKMR